LFLIDALELDIDELLLIALLPFDDAAVVVNEKEATIIEE